MVTWAHLSSEIQYQLSHTCPSFPVTLVKSVATKIAFHPECLQIQRQENLFLIMMVLQHVKQIKQLFNKNKIYIAFMLPHPFMNTCRSLSLNTMSTVFQMQDPRQLYQSLSCGTKLIQHFLKKCLLILLNTKQNQFFKPPTMCQLQFQLPFYIIFITISVGVLSVTFFKKLDVKNLLISPRL